MGREKRDEGTKYFEQLRAKSLDICISRCFIDKMLLQL